VLRGRDRLSEAQVEQALERVVSLFAYLSDKDIFAEVYRNLLAKRMLTAASASKDMERKMLSLLKLNCGANFTAKMENMVNDLEAAAGTDEEFRAAAGGARLPLDFRVQSLCGAYWPNHSSERADGTLRAWATTNRSSGVNPPASASSAPSNAPMRPALAAAWCTSATAAC
jgi:hypothetical protein